MTPTTRLLFLFLFSISASLHASETSLGEVSVRAQGDSTSSTDLPAAQHDSVSFSHVLTKKDFEGRKTTLTEALQEVGGLQTKRYGGLDDFATISIRGSTSEQVSIYVDGIPLNQGIGGGVNIANIPTDQIERVEIYKGSAPASFGTSSIGGVVNIVTKKAAKKWETKITQSYGSFNTYEAGLNQSGHLGKFSHQLGYQFQKSDGDFFYFDNNGTPFNGTDDRVTKRINNQFDRHNLFTKVQYDISQTWNLKANNQFFTEDRGIPGLATLTSTTAHFSTIRNGTGLELTKKNFFKNTNASFAPYFQFLQENFQDPNGEIGLGIQDNQNNTLQYGQTFTLQSLIKNQHHLSTIVHYRGEQFLPKDLSSSSSELPKSVRNQVALSLEDEIFLFNEKIVLNPSLRTEHIFNDFSTTSSTHHPLSGKIGMKYHYNNIWTARTNISRSYRIPNFSELFGDRGAIVGNTALRPESGWNWDIGTSGQWEKVRVDVSYFLNHVDDLIQFLQTSQFTVQAENLSKARIQGVETAVLFIPWKYLTLSQNYTFQEARNTSGLPGVSGNILPGRPMHQWNSKTTLHNDWGKVFVETSFMDGNYLDSQNILRVERRLFLTSGISAQFLKKMTLSFEAKNLLNERVADVVGFPLPGRSYYGKIEIGI
ncbi:MAG: TonB-dependent receptor [Deltaproteobacteria bacterium]|nr:MAG: TonB-dependent receptor [Deltaproteobacteria bacterium]